MNKKAKPQLAALDIERIKRLAIVAMFSDDELLDRLVLKGGNAMALVHQLSSRMSVDLDFSIHQDFSEGVEETRARIERALQKTFRPEGLEPFDVRLDANPEIVSEDLAGFWGGYNSDFKLISIEQFYKLKDDKNALSRSAINVGSGPKVLMDFSRFEFVDSKQATELDGYRIYVYSPEMIACEKLRALCQQLPEYSPVVKRGPRKPASRPRDFFDIYVLVSKLALNLTSPASLAICREMFAIKHVELDWLLLIPRDREFHRLEFAGLRDTVGADVVLQPFDFYVDFVAELAAKMHRALTTS